MTVLITTNKQNYSIFFERSEIFEQKQSRFCEEFRNYLKVTNGEFVKKMTDLA